MSAALKAALEREALAAGFVKMGVCRPDAIPEAAGRLRTFLEAGRHGQMDWIAEREGWRGDPAALWPEARSVIMLAESYAPKHDPLEDLARRDRGAVSVYAQGRDYHDVVKKRLKRVARWLVGVVEAGGFRGADGEWVAVDATAEPLHEVGEARGMGGAGGEKGEESDLDRVPLSSRSASATAAHSSNAMHSTDAHSANARHSTGSPVKVFVDTAPVMEKPLAQAAGLGWQGKHTNLLGRDFGNWVFLGAIFTTLELPPDAPETEHCGSCTRCLDVCPTDAFPAPFQLDARRCISYLTIEHRGPVDESLRAGLGNRIYGCDDCLAVCPWNKFAVDARDMRLATQPGRRAPELAALAGLDEAGFRAMFAGSPVKRIGRDRFVRNVCYAIGNSGDRTLAAAVAPLTQDPDEGVADAARWARVRLGD